MSLYPQVHRTGTTRAIHARMEGSAEQRGSRKFNCASLNWWPALLLVSIFLGCGGLVGSSPTQPPPPSVTVSVFTGCGVSAAWRTANILGYCQQCNKHCRNLER